MAFSVQIGRFTGDRRDLNKSLWILGPAKSGTLMNESDVVNPSILINAAATDIADANYMFIEQFERKYFITDITAVNAEQCIVSGHCDVLETYKSDIKGSSGIVTRSTSAGDPYINDGSIRTKTTKTYKVLRGYAKFNSYSIILVTV